MAKKQKNLKEDRDMAKKQDLVVVEEDRISGLPESLIYHILSFLGMKTIVKTSLLSKRWRKVWASTPVLKFSYEEVPLTSELARVITSLLLSYEAPNIKEFAVTFDYGEVDHRVVDSWVRFAVRHDVEALRLYFLADVDFGDLEDEMELEKLYVIPQCLFACTSLRLLDVEFCVLNVRTSFCFRFLKTLRLRSVNFNSSLDTSCCPLLEDISLDYCNCRSNLDIHAPNEKLKRVQIADYFTVVDSEFGLSIYAPKLLSVSFGGCIRSVYNIKDLSSVVSAELEFERMFYEPIEGDAGQALILLKLFRNLSHARTVELCQWCIEVFSFAEMKGWKTLAYSATHLKAATNLEKLDLPGLAYLLRGSPHLQTLTLKVNIRGKNADFWSLLDDVAESICWKLLGLELSASFHLKTVDVVDFLHNYDCDPKTPIGELLELSKSQIKLIKMLLGCCKELDKLCIAKTRFTEFKSELLLVLTKKLLVFPRASANAEVCLS